MAGFLLDTHMVLWYFENTPQLSHTVRNILAAAPAELRISTVTWWELAIKHSIGKLRLPVPLPQLIADAEYRGFQPLPIHPAHILQVSRLPFPPNNHRDPLATLTFGLTGCSSRMLRLKT